MQFGERARGDLGVGARDRLGDATRGDRIGAGIVRGEQLDAVVLARGGERELKSWLFNNPRPTRGTVLLVTNERGDELLGRAMPRELPSTNTSAPSG